MQFPPYDERAYIAAEAYFKANAEEFIESESELLKETIQTIFIDGWMECMKINKLWEN